MTFRFGIGTKLMILLSAFGLAPAALIACVLWYERSDLEALELQRLRTTAIQINDTIDRNLFERYGDVQAFVVNTAAGNPDNWRKPGAENPLVAAMNAYMTNYGLYKLMLLVSPTGEVLAVNTVDGDGKTLDTDPLYKTSFAGASWLRKAIAGEFLNGKDGFTGTVVEGPASVSAMAETYKTDGFALTFAAPLKDGDRAIGVWVNFAGFEFVEQIVVQAYERFAADGYAGAELRLLNDKGIVIVDYDPTARGTREYRRDSTVIGKLNLAERGVEAARLAVSGKTGASLGRHARKATDQGTGYAYSTGAYGFPGLGWSILVQLPASELFADLNAIFLHVFIIISAAAVILAAAGFFIGRRSAQPIRQMTETMGSLASGNTAVEIPARQRSDEIGAMAASVQVFKETRIEAARLRSAQEQAERRAETEKKATMSRMADEFEAGVMGIVQMVSSASAELQTTAKAMTATAEETQRRSTAVAAASEQASSNVQTVAAAAGQLSSSITDIGRRVKESTRIAAQAAAEAAGTNDKIKGLSEAAQKIGDVVKLIADIASQTNLLALNATIEAARAGEAGKGFAVVASEVKMLATQTAKATEEISAKIAEMQEATGQSVEAIGTIGQTIGRINEITTGIASAVEEQGAATQEIARNVQQASAGTTEVSSNIGGVTQAASDAGAAANQVLSSSGELSKQSGVLRQNVDAFIATIRAA